MCSRAGSNDDIITPIVVGNVYELTRHCCVGVVSEVVGMVIFNRLVFVGWQLCWRSV
jgi:hypothetical protein